MCAERVAAEPSSPGLRFESAFLYGVVRRITREPLLSYICVSCDSKLVKQGSHHFTEWRNDFPLNRCLKSQLSASGFTLQEMQWNMTHKIGIVICAVFRIPYGIFIEAPNDRSAIRSWVK